MKPTISDIFSDQDLRRIKDSVTDAERLTSAEIVPFIVDRSDAYDEAVWRAGFLFAIPVAGLFWILRTWTEIWVAGALPIMVTCLLLASSLAMLLVGWVPPLKRLFAGRELLDHRCFQRAQQAFLSEEVFATEGRTGILIFVSLLEQRVVVVGDSGINARVKPDEWRKITDDLTLAVKGGRAGDGMVEAVRAGAALLQIHGLARSRDDRNELSDTPRTGGPR
ncbi:MAG: hypothetical protein OEV30_06345 [Ignavibacteria bacterium]|nr:hypothetical protein [Ignavibacteria bacterium]